ncbi:MAG: DUF1501 domain-containing protein [Pseudomonadota bacterium]|nr:DUF1501 domain-containing protein [Pseudomonadota bacterium]
MITRRQFVSGLLLAGGFCLSPFGRQGWALAAPQQVDRHLIVILMRGAVDGLSIVAPFTETNYYAARPTIAIAPPGEPEGLLNLDGSFGLHPSLSPLMPLWENRSLAFIHASGSPAITRSHFEAQDILETALLNSAMAQQGWLNGLAQVLPDNHSATRALSFGNTLPKIFQGHYNVATVPTGLKGRRKDGAGAGAADPANPQIDSAFGQLYAGGTSLERLYKQGMSARDAMTQDLGTEMETSGQGAPGADAFVVQSMKAAALIRNDPSVQLVFMDVGGWDTHVQQGNAKGQLANKLERLGTAVAALVEGLGARYLNSAILVMSEFGRTVAQNGNNGTDHGHGNVAWLFGGGVRGGKVYARWPGLGPTQLYEGRDLSVTTDFRSIIGSVITGHFGLDDAAIRKVIADYRPDPLLSGLVAT